LGSNFKSSSFRNQSPTSKFRRKSPFYIGTRSIALNGYGSYIYRRRQLETVADTGPSSADVELFLPFGQAIRIYNTSNLVITAINDYGIKRNLSSLHLMPSNGKHTGYKDIMRLMRMLRLFCV
jgi:hypothetical protein